MPTRCRAFPPAGLVALLLLAQVGTAQAATHTVTPSSNWQTTVNNAASGDTIVFTNGTYTGTCSNYNLLSISKDITLRAQYTGGAVLDAQGSSSNNCCVLRIYSGTVEITGLNITGGYVSPSVHVAQRSIAQC